MREIEVDVARTAKFPFNCWWGDDHWHALQHTNTVGPPTMNKAVTKSRPLPLLKLKSLLGAGFVLVENFDRLFKDSILVQTFPLRDSFRGYAIVQPGRVLDGLRQQAIYSALKDISIHAFGNAAAVEQYWSYHADLGYFYHLAELFLLANSDNRIVGFSGYSLLTGKNYVNFYVDLTAVIEDVQARGAMSDLLDERLVNGVFTQYEEVENRYASTRTQNPVVYLVAKTLADPLYPAPTSKARTPPGVLDAATDLITWLGGNKLQEATLIQKEAYPSPLFPRGQRPNLGQKAIDSLFEQLDDRDAYLLIGRVRSQKK
jgi:hypothetical protein